MDGQRGGKRSFKVTHLYKCMIGKISLRSLLSEKTMIFFTYYCSINFTFLAAVRETYPKESEKTVHQFIQGMLKNAPASRKSY